VEIISIIERGIEVSSGDFHLIETELFLALQSLKNKPDFVDVFLELSSWRGTSLRSGVWTYYEATDREQVENVIRYLQRSSSEEVICKMYALGNHNYSDEKYQSNYMYPDEWIEESGIIDKWIFENEECITQYMQNLLRNNKGYFER